MGLPSLGSVCRRMLCGSGRTDTSAETGRTSSEWHAVWEKWAGSAQPGEGEQRDVAVERLNECLRSGNKSLDLGGLGLRSLPERLPPHITELTVACNFLDELSQLPEGLKVLDASVNRLAKLPEPLPRGLTYLSVSDNKLTEVPELPGSLEYLNAQHNCIDEFPDLPGSCSAVLYPQDGEVDSEVESEGDRDADAMREMNKALRQAMLSLNKQADKA